MEFNCLKFKMEAAFQTREGTEVQRLCFLITTAWPKQKQRTLRWCLIFHWGRERQPRENPRTRGMTEKEEAGCRTVVWEKVNHMHLPHSKG